MAHLTAGHAFWATGDYRLQPENGVLPQALQGLPAYLSGVSLPPPSNHGWSKPNVWTLGHAYFHQMGHDLEKLLLGGRLMNIGWSLATGLLIFAWTKRIFGPRGAVLALGLWTFCPTFLAHGALATSDMCMTFFMLASVAAYWRHLQDFRWQSGLLSAVVLGLAFVAKYSAVLLPVMGALLAVVRLLDPAPLVWRGRILAGTPRRLLALSLSGLAHIVVVVFTIWAWHRFRFLPSPDAALVNDYTRPWAVVLASLGGPLATLLEWARTFHLLPDAYLYGFAFVADMAQTRGAFLNGETSFTGWVHFFPYAFLAKTPLAVLLSCAFALGLALQRWRTLGVKFLRSDLQRVAPLIVLWVVYWTFSLTSTLNIGHRHLLPIYPVVFIATGALGWAIPRARWIAWLAGALLAMQALASFSARPHYLAFFNRLAGGPAEGYRHLVDSSLDWGQDLPGLADWLKANQLPNPTTPVYLAYFGTGEPAYHGIDATMMVPLLRKPAEPMWYRLEPGVYCISATMLSQAYSSIRGPWTLELERAYQTLRGVEPALLDYARNPARRPELEKEIPAEKWADMWRQYEQLTFTRLCYLLRPRTPDAQIGYSINIYRVSEADIEAVTGSLEAWRTAIEAASDTSEGANH